jgi:gamma-glutamyltranspeptidase/glutathione hydrolase
MDDPLRYTVWSVLLLVSALWLQMPAWGDAITWQGSGKNGAVAAGGRGAVAAGMEILSERGNAADAAVATILSLAVTDYGAFAIGGEVPLIIYDANARQVKVLSGQGRAPQDPEAVAWYYANGIPDQGSYKAMPVPGAVHLCLTALKLYGTKSFEDVVAPTLALLDAGERPWHPALASTLRKMVERERETQGTREEKLDAACDRFYKGDIADDLVRWYESAGSLLRKADLEAHVTAIEDPVSVPYRGYTVHKCSTWTQGPALCQTLQLLEGYDLESMGHLSADYIHVVTEAMKLAFADRDTYYGDPAFVDVPLRALLSDEYARVRRSLIDMELASLERRPGDPHSMRPLWTASDAGGNPVRTPISDTTTCVVADRWGNVVAATPSCNLGGNEPDAVTGVVQGNRLRCLNTTRGHPNCIEPGKRPRITLTPTLVTKDGKPVIAVSVAGGDLQDQTTLNVLLNHVEFGMLPKDAVTAPRFSTGHMENSFDSNSDRDAAFMSGGSLQVHADVGEVVQADLQARAHSVTTTSAAIASPVMILIDQTTGTIYAAGDPAAGRHAAALP